MRKAILFMFVLAVSGLAAHAAESIPSRLDKMKAGEWILMQDVSGESGERTKITVLSVTPEAFTLRREHMDPDGTVTETKEHEIPMDKARERHADLEGKAKEVTKEFVIVKDKEIPVTAVFWESDKAQDGKPREFKIWLSDELPVTGLAKFWSSSSTFPNAEIIDYGFAGN